MASLEDVSLLNPDNIAVTKEHLKTRCKQVYHPRRVKNKGALLVLVWNFLTMSEFYLLNDYLNRGYTNKACFVILGISIFIAGWLADTRIERYKVVHTSIWIMWITAVIATVSSVIANFSQSYHNIINENVLYVILFAMAVGLQGFLASIVQFGLDQLHDASTSEFIKSFIIWYVWTTQSSGIPMQFIFKCIRENHSIFTLMLVCANLSLAMVFLFTCNHCLIKKPVQQNSLKLVYKVIRYAIKNKYPRQRSAFTYCEDELPSHIDFGKIKYMEDIDVDHSQQSRWKIELFLDSYP